MLLLAAEAGPTWDLVGALAKATPVEGPERGTKAEADATNKEANAAVEIFIFNVF